MYDKQEVCCFIGHRRVGEKETLKLRIYSVTEKLINSGMRVFLFGDHSEFNDMCYEAVTELKSLYPQKVRCCTERIIQRPMLILCGFILMNLMTVFALTE